MIKRKVVWVALLCVLLVLALTACGGEQTQETANNVGGNIGGDIEHTDGNKDSSESEYQEEDDYREEPSSSEEETETEEDGASELKDAWRDLTDEQMSMLSQYVSIESTLNKYAKDQTNYKHKRSEELEALYQRLIDLEPLEEIPEIMVQSYLNFQGYKGALDRQGLFDRFTILEDVGIYQTMTVTEHSGKVSTDSQISWNYTEDGEVCWENPFNNDRLLYNSLFDYEIQREYDAAGRLAKTLYYERSTLTYTVIYTYDTNGHLILERRELSGSENNGKEFEITCDDQGRVTKAHWQDFWDTTVTYEYDAAGRMVKAEKVESYNGENHISVEYQYDGNGNLDTGKVTYWTTGFYGKDDTQQVNTIDYVCDDKGRVISSTTTVGHVYYTSGDQAGSVAREQKNATVTIETTYGNYYFYK